MTHNENNFDSRQLFSNYTKIAKKNTTNVNSARDLIVERPTMEQQSPNEENMKNQRMKATKLYCYTELIIKSPESSH